MARPPHTSIRPRWLGASAALAVATALLAAALTTRTERDTRPGHADWLALAASVVTLGTAVGYVAWKRRHNGGPAIDLRAHELIGLRPMALVEPVPENENGPRERR